MTVRMVAARLPSEMLRNRARQRGFGHGTHNGVHFLSAFENHQSRDAANPVLASNIWIFVSIQLENLDLALKFLRDLVNNWSNHAAWSAPWSPEVNQDRNVTLKDILFKGCVGYSGSAGHSTRRRYGANLATTVQIFSESAGGLQNCDGFEKSL